MKLQLLLAGIFLACAGQLFAQQHPLVGTWKFVSGTGTNAEGKPITMDTTVMQETKIFSPTHFMYMLFNVKGDSLVFGRAIAGTWKVEGNTYIETPTIGSQDNLGSGKIDFTWKIEGDKFIRQGTITQPNGQIITIHALVFQKVPEEAPATTSLMGTWNQVSSSFVSADGTKGSHTNATHTRFQILSNSYWMRISKAGTTFEHAMGGTYTVKGTKAYPTIEWASFPVNREEKMEMTYRLSGDKLYTSGILRDAGGKQLQSFEDVFQHIGTKHKMVKAASSK